MAVQSTCSLKIFQVLIEDELGEMSMILRSKTNVKGQRSFKCLVVRLWSITLDVIPKGSANEEVRG